MPADYQTAGMIVDDEIFDTLIGPLPKGVRLTAVMDCCKNPLRSLPPNFFFFLQRLLFPPSHLVSFAGHSGSVFDLPYSYVLDGSRDIPIEVDNRKVTKLRRSFSSQGHDLRF